VPAVRKVVEMSDLRSRMRRLLLTYDDGYPLERMIPLFRSELRGLLDECDDLEGRLSPGGAKGTDDVEEV
jgi:hypothetical protein